MKSEYCEVCRRWQNVRACQAAVCAKCGSGLVGAAEAHGRGLISAEECAAHGGEAPRRKAPKREEMPAEKEGGDA